MPESSKIFSAFVRNDLVDGQRVLVLECLAQDTGCGSAWGGQHYEFLFDRIATAPPHILRSIGVVVYPSSSYDLGYRTLHQNEVQEVETALTLARERAALAA